MSYLNGVIDNMIERESRRAGLSGVPTRRLQGRINLSHSPSLDGVIDNIIERNTPKRMLINPGVMLRNAGLSGIDGLGRFSFKKSFRRITKPVEKLVKKDPLFKAVKKVELKVDKEIARSKYAQGVLYGAGAVFAPFTGGASLAIASAAVNKAKANAKGRSLAAQFGQAAVGGAIGYAAGYGIAAAYGAAFSPAVIGAGGQVIPAGAISSAAASDAGMLFAPAAVSSIAPAVAGTASAFSVGGALATGVKALTLGVMLKNLFGGKAQSADRQPTTIDTGYGVNAPAGYTGAPGETFVPGGSGSGGGSGGSGGPSDQPGDQSTDTGIMSTMTTVKMPWILGGGALLVATLLLTRKRTAHRR